MRESCRGDGEICEGCPLDDDEKTQQINPRQVLFGDAAHFDVTSRPGRGTKVTLAIPLGWENEDEPQFTPAAARSSTRS